jgi:hypothetical protein
VVVPPVVVPPVATSPAPELPRDTVNTTMPPAPAPGGRVILVDPGADIEALMIGIAGVVEGTPPVPEFV